MSNNRKLKIGFAMGGGVSLGSFSGAALSEAIRQIVLYSQYENIEIDIFAGASAGSMSLAIMLRGLAYQTEAEKQRAEKTLRDQLTNPVFDALSDDKKKDIIAAQVVQDLQYDIWVKEINIFKLLGLNANGKETEDLTFEPGLVRRNALSEIAQKFFNLKLEAEGQVNFTDRRLLGKRVLFGSTLTNLTPLKNDSRKGNAYADHNYTASHDAFTSLTHREVRVFDLNFAEKTADDVNDQSTHPGKWVRYHLGDKIDGVWGDLNSLKPWSKIVSTSMACGAFPFAFEPVVLKRYQYEYGADWPKELSGLDFQKGEPKLWYPFTYVDGGTMNNEPVREAFRLASFQDAGDISDFDRVIIFVDPFLGDDKVDYRVPIHKQFKMGGNKVTGFEVKRTATLGRLGSHVGNMLNVLTAQVRNNENDKIHDTLELFRDRQSYCQPLFSMIEVLPETQVDSQLKTMREKIIAILDNERENELLPVGAITFREELIRIRKEHLDHIQLITIEDITRYCSKDPGTFPLDKKRIFLKACYAILVNILTGLAGKSSENKIVAIAPVYRDAGNNEKPILLPGSYLAAFSGFFSEVPNEYEVRLAKYCARDFLKRSKIIPENAGGELIFPGEFSDDEKDLYNKDFYARLRFLKDRIANLLAGDHPLGEWFISVVLNHVNTFIDKLKLENDPVDKILVQIQVSDSNFVIDGVPDRSDVNPMKVQGKEGLYCVTELEYHTISEQWEGPTVQPSRELLIQKNGLVDRNFCWIALPDKQQMKQIHLYPNPILTLKEVIADAHKGQHMPVSVWTIEAGVKPLDSYLLCPE